MSMQARSTARTVILRLVEIILVFGILGILLRLAARKFELYESRAKQTEVKISLVSLFLLEKSFHADYGAFIPALDALGYVPEGQEHYYSVGWKDVSRFSHKVTEYDGVANQFHSDSKGVPYASECPIDDCLLCASPDGAPFDIYDTQELRISGISKLNKELPCDIWSINEKKHLVNLQNGLE